LIVVFLDRDGVINVNKGDYVRTADDFAFLPGAFEGLARLKEAGAVTIVVSNQAGVGGGLIEPGELDEIDLKMLGAVAAHGGEIAGIYYCPHQKDADCDCRKPEIGLFLRASQELGFDLNGSYFIGDARTDIEAGRRAGCTTVLVLTGLALAEDIAAWRCKPDHIAADLPAAVGWILQRS
jgi:D-glycero-D-manno-heptose 1,7-bisphosphate phosphatase